MLIAGDTIKIVKGCAARSVCKGTIARVVEVESLGADYGHSMRVRFEQGRHAFTFYARHANRLADPIINLNDGNPNHTIKVQKKGG
jgi:hypothetical protein